MRVTCTNCGGHHAAWDCKAAAKKSTATGTDRSRQSSLSAILDASSSSRSREDEVSPQSAEAGIALPVDTNPDGELLRQVKTALDRRAGDKDGHNNSAEGSASHPIVPLSGPGSAADRPDAKSGLGKKALEGEVPRVNEHPETGGKLVQVQHPQPTAKFDKKAWMRANMPAFMRKYRAEVKAGIRVPVPRVKK